MTERVYLHVGAPKSGTTYLQQVLELNRSELAQAGVLVVGSSQVERIHASMVVREDKRLEKLPPRAHQAWARLVEQIRAWEGPVAVLSYELFAGATTGQAERALGDLAGLEVHVVVTGRDLGASVPSAWQERLKFALTTPLEEWEPRPESAGPRAEWGWRTLDPAGVAKRWGATLPPERVHVVTVPRAGAAPGELWRRFADALGLAALEVGRLDLAPERSNESLGVVEAELLRRVNVEVGDRITGNREHAVWLRDTLAHGVLAGLGDERIGLTDEQFATAEARSRRSVERITRGGYAVHGDLDDLLATRPEARTPGQVTDSEVAASGVAAVGELLLLVRERTQERNRARGEEEPEQEEPGGLRGRGRRLLQSTSAVALRRETGRLRARVEVLEAELQARRRLHLRVAELTDLVAELLLPAAEADGELVEATLARYRRESL